MRLVETPGAFVVEGLPAPFRAGFTTRGAAEGREDEALARALGVPAAERVRARQVHGAAVLFVDGPVEPGAARRLGDGDAVATRDAGRLVTVSTADCVPLLLVDPAAGLVAAVHAGWRGAAARIAEAALDALAARGAAPERMLALLGPSIARERYEVGPEVVAALGPAPEGAVMPGRDDRSLVDVAAFVVAHLLARGVCAESVFRAPLCTFEDARFPSYRRDGARAGRMLTGIVRVAD